MSSYKKWVSGFILLLLSLGLFVVTRPQKCADSVCTDKHLDTPPYGVPGLYSVGSRALETGDEPPLIMNIWYPALAEGGPARETAYPYKIKLGAPFGAVQIASSAGRAAQDAPFNLAQGPYPLVILSPGFALGATSYAWLAEHLASYGFVVIALEHHETLDPQNELWRVAVTRPQDIQSVFAYVDTAVGTGGTLEGLIDPEVAAVIGHSYGGYTALVAAGAQIDTVSFKTHCEEARKAEEPIAWLCDMLLPHIGEMAELAGLDAIPEGLWPGEVDPRVDAVVSMAGDAYFFGRLGLNNVDAPVLAVGGTLDSDTPFQWGPQPTYEYTSSPIKALLALNDAEHMIFTNTCESIRWYAKMLVGEFCSDSVWNRNQAHALIGHFTTAFLLAELKQDAVAAAILVPDAVSLPQVIYTAQGY